MTAGSKQIAPGLRVGVLMGGPSAEHEVSLASGRAVAAGLRRRGWDVVELEVDRRLPWRLEEESVEVAWVALHGQYGEDGCVQGLLELMRIPYTGSAPGPSALCMDKHATKKVLTDTGIFIPPHRLWRRGDPRPEARELPLVAKIPSGGSSIGVVLCRDEADLKGGLERCLLHQDVLMLERLIEGEEITVAVLDGEALPAVGIEPGAAFFDYKSKYTKGRTRYRVPARVSRETADTAARHAELAYQQLCLSGLVRADFIVDRDGRPWFLEVNTIPGMTQTSLCPMAAAEIGVDFDHLVEVVLLGARLHLRPASDSGWE